MSNLYPRSCNQSYNYHSITSSSASEEVDPRISNEEPDIINEVLEENDGSVSRASWRRSCCTVAALLLMATVVLRAAIFQQQQQQPQEEEEEGNPPSWSHQNDAVSMLGMAKSGLTNMKKQRDKPSSSSSDTTNVDAASRTLSKRGRTVHPGRDDIWLFEKAKADPYDPNQNPKGYLTMVIAENNLMTNELAFKLQQVMSHNTTTIPPWAFDYGPMAGQQEFRAAIARMMQSSWMHPAPVSPDKLILQAGAGVVLDNLAWILADANDGVLINAPTYSNFAGDFAIHGQAVMHVARPQPQHNYEPTIDELEQAYTEAVQAGHAPKIYVICQPNNPVGLIYSPVAMKRMITWALQKGLHVVSDEIYGNSVFPGHSVTSAAHIMRELHSEDDNYLTDKVHIVAGLSKDWGMSGFRVGSLFTHNKALITAMETISYYCAISQYTQFALTGMLEDEEWRDWYLAENRRRLEEVFYAAQAAFHLIGVPIFPSTGALFIWADFSSYLLPGQTEQELWLELFHKAKILFATGESFFEDKAGLFRVVYPWPKGGVTAMQAMGTRLVQWKEDRKEL